VTSHCEAFVREQDKDRYLATLYAPETARQNLFSLYAFDTELARIPGLVSEPAIGEIRLQWWRDTISSIYTGASQDHPVAIELVKAVQTARWPGHALQDMIDARSASLHGEAASDLSGFELHLGKMFATPIQLACLALGQSCAEAAGLAGVAYGLAKILASGAKLDFGSTASAEHARMRLAQARSLTVPREALSAFLHVSLTEVYLSATKKSQGEVSPLRRQFTVWHAAWRNRF
jgi:15-cis-phytoene synthase